MNSSTTITTPANALLSDWERLLLLLPAVAGLFFGIYPLFLPDLFAAAAQFKPDDTYIYQLAGSATLGYGVALTIGLFQKQWLAVRFPVIGVLTFNLCSLYACGISIIQGQAPYSVYIVLAASVLFVAISILLLVRHAEVPHPEADLASTFMRIFLVVGVVSAAGTGLLALFVPEVLRLFNLHGNALFIARQAGAASLGYAAMGILAQRALNSRELFLSTLMAAIFNGASGIVSIPYILAGNLFLLPWVIAPIGLAVLVCCLLVLRQAMVTIGK